MSKKGLTKAFLEEIDTNLTLCGYKRFNRSDRVFVKEISNNVYAWIFINPARPYDGELEINPVVGVLHLPLEKLICEMAGGTEIKPSISSHVGYLMPGNTYIPIYVTAETISEQAKALTKRIVLYAEKLTIQNLRLEQLLDTLLYTDMSLETFLKFKVPMIKYLLGEYKSCLKFLDEKELEYNPRQDVEAIKYKQFIQNLRAKVNSIPGGQGFNL